MNEAIKYIDTLNESVLNEMSLSRIWKHATGQTKRPVGFISAWRTFKGVNADGKPIPYTIEEKRDRNDRLENMIKNTGFGYIKIKGGYIEDYNTEKARPAPREKEEDSFMVIGGPEDNNELRNFIIEMGEYWDQDSVMYVSPNKKVYYIGTNKTFKNELGEDLVNALHYKEIIKIGDWHVANELDEYYSKWKGRKFNFRECTETVLHGDGMGWLGKWAKHLIESKK
jgi:hypothetical protein